MKRASGEELEELRAKWQAGLVELSRRRAIRPSTLYEHVVAMMADSGLTEFECRRLLENDLCVVRLNPQMVRQIPSCAESARRLKG
jgi:hypothetical protein